MSVQSIQEPVARGIFDLDPKPTSDWAILAKTVAQLAMRIIFPLATVVMFASVLPITFSAILLPVAAIGSSFLSAFFFQPDTFYPLPASRPSESLLRDIPRPLNPHPPPALVATLAPNAPRGIGNASNNCWLNSDLQLLNSDPFIHEWIRNPLPQPPANLSPVASEDYKKFAITHLAFQNFFKAYDDASVRDRAVTPGSSQTLRMAIHRQRSWAISNSQHRQEDAHEGVSAILDYLPDTQRIRCEVRTHRNTAGLPAIQGHPDGIVSNEELPWCLQLPITGAAPQMQEMIRAYCDERVTDPINTELESVDGNNRRYPITRIERTFLEAPPTLRLQIKRFNWQKPPNIRLTRIPHLDYLFPQLQGRTVKNNIAIQIPLQLPLTLADGTVQNYRLKSFNCHMGETPNSGHYTAYSRVGEQWYFENDSFVQPVELPALQKALASGEPYMVSYERE
jgi:hypothetical protein